MAGTNELWYIEKPENGDDTDQLEPPALVFYVQASSLRRNASDFSIEAVVRHNCNSRMQGQGKGKPSITKVDAAQLYDILGLLRALQFDVAEYNQAVEKHETMTSNERRYACYRLIQQAMALGVRLTAPWRQTERKAVAVPGLDELIVYLENEFKERLDHAKNNLEQGVVDFDSLMEFYRPGEDLLNHGLLSGLQTMTPMMVRCRASHYSRGKSAIGKPISNFHASLECVVATGRGKFAVVESRMFQYEFKGTRRIEDSGTITGEICTKATNPAVLQDLESRGKIYEEVCSKAEKDDQSSSSGRLVHYVAGCFWPVKQAIGSSVASTNSKGGGRSSRTGGRMMVDTVEAASRGIHPAKAPADGVAGEAVAEAFKAVARLNRQKDVSENSGAPPSEEGEDDMDDDVLLLGSLLPASLVRRTWPVVCGFSLESRSWGLALVDGIKPVQFHEQAFDDLVLPQARKRLLRALITSHGQDRKGVGVDVLPGKGEGIIFLLHGPPGVGKTLTAEAVSEVLHRPLYRVSMGELGTTPESLESRLQEIFDLCLPWQALVLIDEAEMLLETRSHSGTDLVRNAMVCVMLRLMEYYPGILFLTTNSGKDKLDPAIASRLTCTLGYSALSESGRREIWKTTLGRVEMEGKDLVMRISDSDLDYVARVYSEVNGRQIKNAVQLASALCRYEKTALNMEHLKETLDMTNVEPTAE